MALHWVVRVFHAALRLFREKVNRKASPLNSPVVGDWARLRRHQSDERLGKVLWIDKNRTGVEWIVGGDGRALPGAPCIVHLYELEKVS